MRFVIIIMLFPLVCLGQSLKHYQGLGILSVSGGDTIIIYPDTAYLINQSIFDVGMDAVDFVKSGGCDSVMMEVENRYLLQVAAFKDLDKSYKTLQADYHKYLQSSAATIKQLEDNTATQKLIIADVKASNKAATTALKDAQRKVRNRNFTIVGVVIAAVTGIVFL